MPGTPSSEAPRPARGRVEAVFEIRDRGVVVVVGELEGIVRPGHTAVIGGVTARVAGIEMISPRLPAAVQPITTGLLLTGIDKATAQAAIGTQMTLHPGEAS
ncbi:hypothetical protein [Jannaschia sp. CCS1]|uniref:hypothetical protein n=1 Tax=Jannaschia sp. (strain CCS1) TaxID=290400 RepID=UPI000053A8DF|nr:hypothetical protein [Jannaschia sp. CCS1]ABD55849.1 hypothetical protein Jann_2932 [Jannaschia sp. CCS1]